ncbi:hypothetical protein [Geodermatophilus sp. DSM 44513]|uniref:hypothetical protein n=1 Tax=Geodermatophilus sp. DSM 44513 TaxID=1528104 RepID=UPI00127BAFC9|nr:hypothetical protein [Geodermatophilus sp. DSM 44513]WNV76398.1 hypothetical protein RTG05_03795 [Geodermatophilus sp. DSM 44513]
MTTDDTDTRRPAGGADDGAPTARRRTLLAAVAGLVVAGVVALVLLLGDDADGGTAPAAAPSTPAEATDAGGTADPTTPTGEPSAAPAPAPAAVESAPAPVPGEGTPVSADLPPALPEVPLDAPVTVEDGLVVELSRIEAIEGTGQGPGNVSGPALRVTVRIQNTSPAPLPLDGVTVNAYHGGELTPASPLEDPSRQPLVGELPEGEAAEGVYVFSVPREAMGAVTVELAARADAPRVLFSGPVD